nr:DUF1697 domain-containing protein [Serinicoccus sp. CUA-874]
MLPPPDGVCGQVAGSRPGHPRRLPPRHQPRRAPAVPQGRHPAGDRGGGFQSVATYINTGNVRPETRSRSRARIEARLEAAYLADRGFEAHDHVCRRRAVCARHGPGRAGRGAYRPAPRVPAQTRRSRGRGAARAEGMPWRPPGGGRRRVPGRAPGRPWP